MVKIKTKVLTKDEVIEKLREHRDTLKKFGVKRMGLFGFFVRGEQKRKSDIDMVVEFDSPFLEKISKGFLTLICVYLLFLKPCLGERWIS